MNDYRSIFSEINSHMLQGIMMHDQLYRLFLFLRLYTFAKFHKKQYREEDTNYKKLNKYYIRKQNKLITEGPVNASNTIIPLEWHSKTRYDLSADEVRNAVQFSIGTWVDWERRTKELYSASYRKLIDLGYVAEAQHIAKLLKDVDKELSEAEDLQIRLNAIGYDLIEIMDMNE